MYCPKCGQETINISGKEACTTCGVLYDNIPPADQVSSQILERAVEIIPAAPTEKYVSPTDIHMETDQPQAVPKDEEKSLNEFIKTWGKDGEISEKPQMKQEEPVGATAAIPDFPVTLEGGPRITSQEPVVIAEANDEKVLNITEQNIPTKAPASSDTMTSPLTSQTNQSQKEGVKEEDPLPSQGPPPEASLRSDAVVPVPPTEEEHLESSSKPQAYEKVISKEGISESVIPVRPEFAKEVKLDEPPSQQELFDESKLIMENGNTDIENVDENAVYASHQLNPGMAKAVILSAIVVLIIITIIFVYQSRTSFPTLLLNIATFIGESLFK